MDYEWLAMKKKSIKRQLIASTLKRRDVLGFLGGVTAISLLGCARKQVASSELMNTSSQVAAAPGCLVRPEQTQGPYFVDERLNRSDIRSDPSSGLVKDGVPLQLAFQVSQVSGEACTPLQDVIVDVWHCDAEGTYSDVNEHRFNTAGQKFLRGYQLTDADGVAQFLTIYPGAYPGRAVHIHFKLRTQSAAQPNREFTSQLYFDDALTDLVYQQPPYSSLGQRMLNRQDGIFQNGGEQLTLQLVKAENGYTARFAVGLESA